MKTLFAVLLLTLGFRLFAGAQSALLDGRQFTIQLYIGNDKDDVDTLFFENSMMRFSTARKYGFIPDLYKAKEKNGVITFTATFESKKNGKFMWDGKVKDDLIEGRAVWEQPLQNPVEYNFITKPELK